MPRRPTRVDLTHRDDRLTGRIFGEQVALPLDIPHSNSATSGTYGGVPVTARWKIASNYNTSEQPASLVAIFGDDSVELTTTFMFRDDQSPTLVGATIVGNVASDPVNVHVSPGHDPHDQFLVDGHVGPIRYGLGSSPAALRALRGDGIGSGPASSRSSRRHDPFEEYIIDGHVGTCHIAVIARASREKSTVEGTIDGDAVKLTATHSPAREDGVRIKGRWHGEPSLCLLSVAGVLYFM